VIKVWDLRTLKCLQTLQEEEAQLPEDTLSCLAFDPRRQAIVCASSCPCAFPVRGFMSSFPSEPVYKGHHAPIVGALYNRTFDQILTADHARIMVWDTCRGERLNFFDASKEKDQAMLSGLAMDRHGRRLLAVSPDSLRLYNFASGQELRQFLIQQKDGTPVPGFAKGSRGASARGRELVGAVFVVEPDRGTTLIVAAAGNTVVLWLDQQEGSSYASESVLKFRQLAFSGRHCPDDNGHQVNITSIANAPPLHVAVGTDRGPIGLYSFTTNEVEGWLGRSRPGGRVEHLYSQASVEILLAIYEVDAIGWSLRTRSPLWVIPQTASALGPAMVGTIMEGVAVTGDDHGVVAIWDTTRHRPSRSSPRTPGDSMEVNFSGLTSTPGVNIMSARLRRSFRAHPHALSAVEIVSPRGTPLLLSCSGDCQARLWTLSGQYIGYFGQRIRWRFNDGNTWASYIQKGPPGLAEIAGYSATWSLPPDTGPTARAREPDPADRAAALGWRLAGDEDEPEAALSCPQPVLNLSRPSTPGGEDSPLLSPTSLSPRCPVVPRCGPASPARPAPSPLPSPFTPAEALRPAPPPFSSSAERSASQGVLVPQAPARPPLVLNSRRLKHNRLLSAKTRKPEEASPSGRSGATPPEVHIPEIPAPETLRTSRTDGADTEGDGEAELHRAVVAERMARRERLLRTYTGRERDQPPDPAPAYPNDKGGEAQRVIDRRIKGANSAEKSWTTRPTGKLLCREPAPVPVPQMRQIDNTLSIASCLRAATRVAGFAAAHSFNLAGTRH